VAIICHPFLFPLLSKINSLKSNFSHSFLNFREAKKAAKKEEKAEA
jgi:hypothetical protein